MTESTNQDALSTIGVEWWSKHLTAGTMETYTFKELLTGWVKLVLSSKGNCVLSTDYVPQDKLLDICNRAGIDPLRVAFPQKAVMTIDGLNETIFCKIGMDEVSQLFPATG